MTRVLMLSGIFRPDRCGVAHYTDCLRADLERRALDVSILTTHDAAANARDEAVVGAVSAFGAADMATLARAIRHTPHDLLHIQYAPGTYRFRRAIHWLPALLRVAGERRPTVVTLHEYGGWNGLLSPLLRLRRRHGWWDEECGLLPTSADAVIVTNETAGRLLRERHPGLSGRIRLLPIGINVAPVPIERAMARGALRRRFGWPPDASVLAFFGFIHSVKGLETLCHAVSRLRPSRPALRVVLIGGVESLALPAREAAAYRASLDALIADLGLSEIVQITGHLPSPSVSELLSGADIGVLPFNHGCTLKSGSLLTLLAHGLPVVTTPHEDGPIPPLDRDGLVRLAPRRDPEGLATVLDGLLRDDQGQRALAAAARAFCGERSWETIGAAHHGLYTELVTTTGRSDVAA